MVVQTPTLLVLLVWLMNCIIDEGGPSDQETWTQGRARMIIFYHQHRNSELKNLSPNSSTSIKSREYQMGGSGASS